MKNWHVSFSLFLTLTVKIRLFSKSDWNQKKWCVHLIVKSCLTLIAICEWSNGWVGVSTFLKMGRYWFLRTIWTNCLWQRSLLFVAIAHSVENRISKVTLHNDKQYTLNTPLIGTEIELVRNSNSLMLWTKINFLAQNLLCKVLLQFTGI